MKKFQKKYLDKTQTILARPSREDERSDVVASDYIVYLFASIEIRGQRVLPGSVYYLVFLENKVSSSEMRRCLMQNFVYVYIRDL